MSYKKETSTEIVKARKRLAGAESIDSKLDLGNGLTVVAYQTKINDSEVLLDAYNTLLSKADEALLKFCVVEKDLAALSERILAGVVVKYGYDSFEYEKAGGTRKSDIKGPAKKLVVAK